MAQHFLLSAKARTLFLKSIYAAGEITAYETFRKIRWHQTEGKPVCPHSYAIPSRRKFKCAACYHQFSVTSGTIFASRKMAFVDRLAAVCIVVNAAKTLSALQLSRDLDCQPKTAFVLPHKIGEALTSEVTDETLDGEVEVDGAYFGGHIRPENHKEDRRDRRQSKKHPNADRGGAGLGPHSPTTQADFLRPSSRPSRESAGCCAQRGGGCGLTGVNAPARCLA